MEVGYSSSTELILLPQQNCYSVEISVEPVSLDFFFFGD